MFLPKSPLSSLQILSLLEGTWSPILVVCAIPKSNSGSKWGGQLKSCCPQIHKNLSSSKCHHFYSLQLDIFSQERKSNPIFLLVQPMFKIMKQRQIYMHIYVSCQKQHFKVSLRMSTQNSAIELDFYFIHSIGWMIFSLFTMERLVSLLSITPSVSSVNKILLWLQKLYIYISFWNI